MTGGEAIALDTLTGRLLWRRQADSNGSLSRYLPSTVDKLLTQFSDTYAALNAANGKTAWFAAFGDSSTVLTNTTQNVDPFPDPLSFSLPTPTSPPLGKIETNGRTVVTNEASAANKANTFDRDKRAIYIAANSAPIINRAPRLLRSVSEINTLLAIDSATGQELWRWQPTRNMQFDQIVIGKHRLYLSDDKQIVAIEDGFEEPMPENPRERWMLARHLLSAQYGWPPDPNDFMRRFARWLSPPASPLLAHLQEEKNDENETQLALLALGQNSVIPLVEFVHHAVSEHEQKPQIQAGRNFVNAYEIIAPLDMLFDLNDRSVIPSLIAELERATQPGTRNVLAQSLIHWGDTHALRALFRYAQSATAMDGTREDALYFICQRSPAPGETLAHAGLPPDAPMRDEVTAWLMACLQDRRTPNRLYTYAKFELLNDRGELARRAALATFHCEKRAHLLPNNLLLKVIQPKRRHYFNISEEALWQGTFPEEAQALAVTQKGSRRRWAAFRCHYLGPQEHVWFAQSEGGKQVQRWRRPAFGVNLSERCMQGGLLMDMDYKLTCTRGRLHLKWTELSPPDRKGETRLIRHTEHIAIADLYRDSDGDSIPDRVEQELGLDPHRADTNRNGLPDGTDKNPLYRPHPLTEQEAIYQAVVEALCQLGRSMPVSNGKTTFDDGGTPAPFGRGTAPLLLPAPPGSAGVEMRGHSGMVFCRPEIARKLSSVSILTQFRSNEKFHFTAPFIGLDGSWHGPQEDTKASRPADPFGATTDTDSFWRRGKPIPFKSYFPVVLSRDGMRARIGFQGDTTGRRNGQSGFDVEVRKLNGQWLPVECRRVYYIGRRFSDIAVVPIHDRSETTAMHSSWRYSSF